MAKAQIFDVVFVENIEGRDKPLYHKVGIYREDGEKRSIKLATIPAGPGWNGWLSIFAQKEKQPSAPSEDTREDPF